ncbi:hypothetical protein B0O80DRAFT_163634 [Mortierella sp. GBAus27b]|nr:hypothetical protein BGX31_011094 [Mortierella sp. GBA43]KAI8361603.1 hypothetical protein B0O80DRAFT_163634 [Mortierella sp. GBAus27b]
MSGIKTKVLIVGGGLGGLLLAILLQRAGIDYLILEQSVIIRPYGSIIVISSLVLPLMEQLGMLDEIEKASMPFGGITLLRNDQSVIGRIICDGRNGGLDYKDRYGHYDQCLSRPNLYNILLSRIPKDRLKLGKRFVNFQHIHHPETGAEQVMVRCSDGTYYHADILVGADGASSAVRQSLYRQLKDEGTLPKVDQEEHQYRHVSLIGVTNPLNTKKHPDLKDKFSQFKVVVNKNSPYMCWFMPLAGSKYSWLVSRILDVPVTSSSGNADFTDWGPDATDEMSKAIRHLPGPDGGTMGELLDSTDRQTVSRVILEERFFRTWYGRRTVLIGDACHKAVPFTGKGASESILDAVVLASLLYDLPSLSNHEDLHEAFKTYHQVRSPVAKYVVDSSSQFGSFLTKEGWTGDLIRRLGMGLAASWMAKPQVDKAYYNRIQASFLPRVPERGAIPGRPHVVATRGLVEQDIAEDQTIYDHEQVDEFFTGPSSS